MFIHNFYILEEVFHQIKLLQSSLCLPKQASPMPWKYWTSQQAQRWWAPSRCSSPSPPAPPPSTPGSICPPGSLTSSPSLHPQRPGQCPIECLGWSWWIVTHTRRSDRVLGSEKSHPRARRSLVDPPVPVLSLVRGKKDDHMLETLKIIGFTSLFFLSLVEYSTCMYLEWRTSVEHNQCCLVRLRRLVSGGNRCRLPRKWQNCGFRKCKIGCSQFLSVTCVGILTAPPLCSPRMEIGGRHLCAPSQASSHGASYNHAEKNELGKHCDFQNVNEKMQNVQKITPLPEDFLG